MSALEEAPKEIVTIGRRKNASARVRLQTSGTGKITVNGKDIEEYFPTEQLANVVRAPLTVAEKTDAVDVIASVRGGGHSGQADSIVLGISRALERLDGELRLALKPHGFLKRDPRMRERKKSGQPGARKRFQFSKR
ncbi:MAG: 30S ribosomal protein S9 [Verrucomicrobiota bacterium]